eukprot:13068298-Alexandrium_andersonii.AAC.1
MAKDCRDRGLADCGLELATWRFRGLGPPRASLSWANSESARNNGSERPPRRLRGPIAVSYTHLRAHETSAHL